MLEIWRRVFNGVTSPLFGDYVELRKGLANAKLSNGRLISTAPSQPTPDEALKWLYELLSVLDSKASALMRLNGVVLAAVAFLLNAQGGAPFTAQQISVTPIVALWIAALSSFSIALCLLVVSVDWQFLGRVKRTDKGNDKELDFTDEITNLQRVSLLRQYVYRVAWFISLIAACLFVYAFAFQILK